MKVFLIDPLEKLVVKKDGTLLWALTAQKKGDDCYVVFEKDLYVSSEGLPKLTARSFSGEMADDGYYLKSFELEEEESIQLQAGDDFYMRLDPPFDSRYLKVLWQLTVLENQGVRVANSPKGILNFNEKILPLLAKKKNGPTYIGGSLSGIEDFLSKHSTVEDFIIKPLDLYQGLGVQKLSKGSDEFWPKIKQSLKDFQGTLVVQPFNEKIHDGELRSVYFKGKEIGTIVKVPPKGSYLANIAQGATYEATELTPLLADKCAQMAAELMDWGIDLVAFDLLGDDISEANLTCPGLLVEVSTAMDKNLCEYFV